MQKNSISIMEFAKKIQEDVTAKKDYVVPTKQMMVRPDAVEIHNIGEFAPTEHFHRQVAGFTDIPWKYYNRVMDRPDLFAHNVNHWLGESNANRMVRVLKGERDTARAFLSDRFKRIDHIQIAEAILPPLVENENARVLSCQVTEKRLSLMISFLNKETEVKPGDVIRAGIIISNSEIGLARFSINPYVHRLICDNGAVVNDNRKYGLNLIHIGRKLEGSETSIAYQDDTKKADDEVLRLKMRDVVTSISDGPVWDNIVAGLKSAVDSKPVEEPVAAVKELANVCGLNEGESNKVLTNLIQGGDLSRWGAGNAITETANQIDDYDRATDLQKVGGELFGMNEKQWARIAEAHA